MTTDRSQGSRGSTRERPSKAFDPKEGRFSKVYEADQQRLQISERCFLLKRWPLCVNLFVKPFRSTLTCRMLNAPTVLRSGAEIVWYARGGDTSKEVSQLRLRLCCTTRLCRKPQRTMVNAATQVGIIHFSMTDDSSSDPDFAAPAPDVACDEQVSVTEYVAPAPDVTYTAPAPVIEHVTVDTYAAPAHLAPAPVIEYIAPSPTESYPSFFPSFSQLNEAITWLVNPQFSVTAGETSQERIQEQIVEPIEAPLREHVHLHTAIQMVHVPVPRIQEIPQEHLPERIAEQFGDIPVPPIVEETERLHPRELSPRPDKIVEAAALSVLENVLHERQRLVDHCVQILKREKEKLRVLEERGVVPPHEFQSRRSHIQSGKDAMADAVRDLYEWKQQVKCRRLWWRYESILAADSVRDGITDFHKSVNIGNHFPAGYKDLLLQAAGYEVLPSQAACFATSPHRLRIQTNMRPTDFLRNIINLHDSGCFLTTVEALGMEWRSPRLYIVGAECLYCSMMYCSSQFSRYEASGSTMFLLSIMMYNVDICGAVYQCRVNTGTIMSPAFFFLLDELRWLFPGRIFKRRTRVKVFLSGVLLSHPHGFARFCRAFMRLHQFPFVVMYLCSTSWSFRDKHILFALVHPHCHCITSLSPLSKKKLQISELHFDKFLAPTTFACWKKTLKTEVCTCSQFQMEAALWIKEVVMEWWW